MIELQHSGNSYYRYADNTYAIDHDALKMSFTSNLRTISDSFKKIHEASAKNPILSPYTWWGIKLKPQNPIKTDDSKPKTNSPLFMRFKDHLPGLEIHLIGKGKYIDETELPKDAIFEVDTYYDRIISSMPKLRLDEQIKKLTFKPNPLNQRNNPNYRYQAKDIEVMQKHLMKDYKGDFIIYPPVTNDLDLEKMVESLRYKTEICIYNSELDWGVLAIFHCYDIGNVALYKSINGHNNATLLDKLKEFRINKCVSSKTIQKDPSSIDGMLALENMKIIVSILEGNAKKFINEFSEFEGINSLKQGRIELAKIYYVEAKYEEIKEKKEQLEVLSKIKEQELEELQKKLSNIQKLKHGIKILAAGEIFNTESENLIVFDLVIENLEKDHSLSTYYYSYSYELSFSKNLETEADSLKKKIAKILNLSFVHDSNILKNVKQKYFDIISNITPSFVDFYELIANLNIHRHDIEGQNIAQEIYEEKDDGLGYLYMASKDCSPQVIQCFVNKGIDINTPDSFGRNLLHWAVLQNNLGSIYLLLDKGINLTAQDKNYYTPLHYAAEKGYIEAIEIFLDKGSSVEERNGSGESLLHCAAKGGNIEIVRFLLSKGANPEDEDELGTTPLSNAAQNGHLEAVQLLLNKGANVDTNSGVTPLSRTALNGHVNIMQLLLDKGANIETIDGDCNPLIWAVERGHTEAVKLLLNRGANVEVRDCFYETPLLIASKLGHTEIVELLLDKKANIESAIEDSDNTSLYLASQAGHVEIVELLLDRGANIESEDSIGNTPLFAAIYRGQTKIVKLLLDRGANIKDDWIQGQLSWSARNGYLEIIDLFLNKGVNIDITDNSGRTPLLDVVSSESFDLAPSDKL